MAEIRIEELVGPRSRTYWITEDHEWLDSRDTLAEALLFARAYCKRSGATLISAQIIPFRKREVA
ncbi:hypothetical protein [Cereibacter azotoformans]|uniref:hypothetical protein n=1 Tax=Cereibacter azotoformans TaxID=43057 RepID=UPI000C6C8DDB|nr:hypothetical protein [Cereibacter azotoformans]